MRDLQGWTIVVIGATDGVGYDSAKAFAEHNAHVVLVGRNEEKSQKCVLAAAARHFSMQFWNTDLSLHMCCAVLMCIGHNADSKRMLDPGH